MSVIESNDRQTMLNDIINAINAALWSDWQILIYLLVAAGLLFSWRLGGIQITRLGHAFSLLKNSSKSDASGISAFQALCTSLSARVGNGNLVGVAFALSVGGAGAVFWMWVIAILGMATAFAESLLAQVYKVRNEQGEFRGGPAYYITQGLGQRWLAVLFAICLFLGYGMFFSAMQANTISDAINNAYAIPPLYTGIVIAIISGIIIMGGLRSIAKFAELAVPVMGIAYVLATIAIVLMNIDLVPAMLLHIVQSAFGLEQAAGGTLGAALQAGIQRGLYSNEAGSGSAPHAAASASPWPNHPASQGYIQMLGVFFDTIVLCTCTAFIILLSGMATGDGIEGIRLTQDAMSHHIGGWGLHFVSAAITIFAFTSVVANYAYAQSNLRVFGLDTKLGNRAYILIYLGMVLWGSSISLNQAIAAADMSLGMMTVVNVVAIVLLTPTIVSVSRDYNSKLNNGEQIVFKKSNCTIQGHTDEDIWNN